MTTIQWLILSLATSIRAAADSEPAGPATVALTMPSHGAAAPSVSLESECEDLSDEDFLPIVKALGLRPDVESTLKTCADIYSFDFCTSASHSRRERVPRAATLAGSPVQ